MRAQRRLSVYTVGPELGTRMLQSSWSEAGNSNLSTHFYWPHRSPTQGAFLTSFLPFIIAFNPFPPSLPTFSPLRYKVPGLHIRSRRHSGYCVDMFTGASSTLSQGSCGLCLHVCACCWAHGVLIVAGEQGWGQSTCAEHCPYCTNIWIQLWTCRGSWEYPAGLACVEGIGAEIQ